MIRFGSALFPRQRLTVSRDCLRVQAALLCPVPATRGTSRLARLFRSITNLL